MTQRILNTAIGDRPVTVLMGWDQPLQYYFMVIEAEDADDPLYCNLDDDAAGLEGKLVYFVGRAREMGITIPDTMLARLQTDSTLNLGNATSYFDASGVERAG